MGNELFRAAASLIVGGFPGHSADERTLELLRMGLGGVIFFRRNVDAPVQVAEMINAFQAARVDDAPLLVCVDQEGGKVARLKAPLTEFPELACLGRTGDENLATRFGAVLAHELVALGFNLDFAPVMDVNSNPDNPVIGTRAFSDDPHTVARMGQAVIRAMQNHGLLACAKHFPGHGDTLTDSHLELPELPHSLERLRQIELVPFKAAIEAEVATIMTAHIRFNALDPELPATLSPSVVQGLLRDEMGYQGVVVSDDLEMKAVLDHYGVAESVRRGLMAGVDLFLVCHKADLQIEAIETLTGEAERSSAFRDRLLESAARVRNLRLRLAPYEAAKTNGVQTYLGSEAHQRVAEEIRKCCASNDSIS